MKKVSITELKKGLSALHVQYASFCLIEKKNTHTIEIIILWSSWLRKDIETVKNYLNTNYSVETRNSSTMYITSK